MAKLNIGLCAIVLSFVVCAINATPLSSNQLGSKQCTWGPSYWCGNLKTAKECNAVRHCIQTVWETRDVPKDDNEICKICKDMVTQARDQLRSNETQEELKQVFEGSCKLIPMKFVRKECIQLADDFVPELVEALSSQMNPDQVCSVAGLCNNAKINEMINIYAGALEGSLNIIDSEEVLEKLKMQHDKTAVSPKEEKKGLSCGNCNQIAGYITDKLSQANPDDLLENFLRMCGQMSSFSDACSSIVLTYFNDIHDILTHNMNAKGLCHLSGTCAAMYHQHPEDLLNQPAEEIVDLSMSTDNDIPCELCKQLVQHLRDVLVANTTEEEFKQVLHGLCGQMKSFKDECNSIVDQYSDVIYKALVDNLNAEGACFLAGVCPKGAEHLPAVEIRPLLPTFEPAEIKVTVHQLGQNEPKFTKAEVDQMQLPIDSLMFAPNPSDLVDGGEVCTLCEYALHFVQEYLADPKNEDSVKHVVNEVCGYMPHTVKGMCHDFIDRYGDMIIALVIQGIDPSQICPELKICPHHVDNAADVEIFSPAEVAIDEQDKPTCPLCIFAVEEAQEKIRDNKSKENIMNILSNLCNHLPSKLQSECTDFVHTYSSELIDKLISNFTPQEICVDLTLCPKSNSYLADLGISIEDETFDLIADEKIDAQTDADTDEDETENDLSDELENSDEISDQPTCLICEEVVKKAEKKLGPKPTKDSVKKALNHACDRIKRKNIDAKCHEYVDRYGDFIAELIIAQTSPKAICTKLGLCLSSIQDNFKLDYSPIESDEVDNVNSPQCIVCKTMLKLVKRFIKKKESPEAIKRALGKVCHHIHGHMQQNCNHIVQRYGDRIARLLIKGLQPRAICSMIMLCAEPEPESEFDIEDEVSAEDLNDSNSQEDDVIFELLDLPRSHKQENCTLCLSIIWTASHKVHKHDSIPNIVKALHNVCESMHNHTKQILCNKLVNRSVNFIARSIQMGRKSYKTCSKLNYCPRHHLGDDLDMDEALKYDVIAAPENSAEISVNANDRFTGNDDINVLEPPNCIFCEFAMVKLEKLLSNRTEQKHIKESLEQLCHHMPTTCRKRCNAFVEHYASALIDLISKVPPKQICQTIGLCKVVLEDVSIVADEVIECGVCHGVSSYLLPYFRKHMDLTSIVGADMTAVACEHVPAKYNDVCTEMVSIYGQSILNLAHKEYMDSAHICAEIGKCFNNEKSALAFAAISDDN